MPDIDKPGSVENISAELTYVPHFNLALQQNALPVIYELKIANRTEKFIGKTILDRHIPSGAKRRRLCKCYY